MPEKCGHAAVIKIFLTKSLHNWQKTAIFAQLKENLLFSVLV